MKRAFPFILLLVLKTIVSVPVDITVSSQAEHLRSVQVTHASRIGCGFFCELNAVVNNLIFFDQDGIRSMNVDWTNEFFPYKNDPHENGWDLFFDPITVNAEFADQPSVPVGTVSNHELHDQLCVAPWLAYDAYLPYRVYVHDVMAKYLHVKDHITQAVDDFYENKIKADVCIGVHVRYAQAHVGETPGGKHPSLEEYRSVIDTIIKNNQGKSVKIFLATDSNAVVNYFAKRYGTTVAYLETPRASDKEDPGLIYENPNYWLTHVAEWHKAKPGYLGGLGTLMDCLLLARCNYLIHTTSNVSSFVCFFNPYIKSIYLPKSVAFKHCRFRNDPSIRNKFLNPI